MSGSRKKSSHRACIIYRPPTEPPSPRHFRLDARITGATKEGLCPAAGVVAITFMGRAGLGCAVEGGG